MGEMEGAQQLSADSSHPVHHGIRRLRPPPCPLSFPKGSEGTRDHSTWSVPVGGTSAPTSNPRKHSQLGLNVAAGTWMSQAGSLSQ